MDLFVKNNTLRVFILISTISSVFLFVGVTCARAETGVPSVISYQGRLTDSNGNLLGGAGTPYFFKFSFWDSPTVGQGNRVWPTASPSAYSINVKQGVFNVNIGDTVNGYPDALNYDFNSNKNIYLQVEASANNSVFETLSPRQQITATAFAQVASTSNYSNLSGTSTYSYNAGNAVTASTSDYSDLSGTSTYSTFANNAYTASTSDYATNSGTSTYSNNSNYSNTSGTSTYATNSNHADSATAANSSDYATNAGTSTFSTNSNHANSASAASTSDYSSNSGTSTYANNAGTSTYSTLSGTSALSLNANALQGLAASDFLRSNITTDNLVQGSVNLFYNNSLVQAFLDTIGKGYFFATSSADYWKSQNNFFSTSSANVWDATMNRWATSTSDYWLALKTTDNLSQGSTNKYYSTSLFATDLAGTTTDALAQGNLNKYFTSALFASTLAGTTTDALAQGSMNKYYSNSLFASTLAGTTTDALAQGLTNKYYSTSLFATDLAGTTTTALPEGNNLYFTTSRASTTAIAVLGATTSLPNITTLGGLTTLATSLTGFIQVTSGVISATSSPVLTALSGTLGVTHGGTGQTSYTDGQLLIGNSSTNGLTSATLTGTSNEISVTNGNGSITLATPQAIGTASTPTFASTTLSNFTSGSIPFFGASGVLSQNNTNLFWNNANKFLGIGTSSPSNALEVSGNTFLGGNLTATGTLTIAGTANFNGISNSGGSALTVGTTGFNEAYSQFHIKPPSSGIIVSQDLSAYSSSGRFNTANSLTITGLGGSASTKPSVILGVANSTGEMWLYNSLTDSSNYNRGFVRTTGSSLNIGTENLGTGAALPLNLITSSTTRMTIDTSGNVGIGSTTPGSKLSIHDSSGLAGTNPLFTIASSTSAGAATTTLLTVLGNGALIGTTAIFNRPLVTVGYTNLFDV